MKKLVEGLLEFQTEVSRHGWVYDIAHGELQVFDSRRRRFAPLSLVAGELFSMEGAAHA